MEHLLPRKAGEEAVLLVPVSPSSLGQGRLESGGRRASRCVCRARLLCLLAALWHQKPGKLDFPGLSFRSRDKPDLLWGPGFLPGQLGGSVPPPSPAIGAAGSCFPEPCSPQAQGAVGPVLCPSTPAQPFSSHGHLRSPCSLPALCPSPVKGELRRVDVGGCGPRGAAGPLNPADPGTLAACPEWGPVGRRARCSPPKRRLWGVRCGMGVPPGAECRCGQSRLFRPAGAGRVQLTLRCTFLAPGWFRLACLALGSGSGSVTPAGLGLPVRAGEAVVEKSSALPSSP